MARTCQTAVPIARLIGDPVDVVTGAVIGVDRDFKLPGAFELYWRRHYDSGRHREQTGWGFGFRFEYDRRLIFDLDGLRYIAPDGNETRLPALERDGQEHADDGFVLQRLSELRYRMHSDDAPSMEFVFKDVSTPAPLARLWDAAHAVSFGHDDKLRLMTVADSMGRSLHVTRDGRGLVQRVQLQDPARGVDQVAARYEYDDAGRLVRTTDPYGHSLAYAYDSQGRLTKFSDRNGYAFHYRYDDLGRCIHTRGDDGVEELRMSYDADARMTIATRGNGGQWQYFHNEALQLTQIIDPNGGVTEYHYDDQGKLRREIDPAKRVSNYEYDENGALRVLALPTGVGVDPYAERDPLVALVRRYRVARSPRPEHRPHAPVPTTPADWEQGRVLASREPFDLPVEDTRPQFLSNDEWQSLVRAKQAGVGRPREVRDSYGVLIREERHDGRARHFHYDANGNRARVTDFDGASTRYEYASWNALVRSTDPLGHVTALAYDRDENLTRLVDAGGNRNEYGYGLTRELREVRRNGTLRERCTHNQAGDVIERSDAGQAVELRLAYDDRGLLEERALSSGERQTFEYGALGALSACSGAAGKIELGTTISGERSCDLRDGKGVRHERSWRGVDVTTVLDRFAIKYYRFDDDSTQMVVAPGGQEHRIRRCGSGVIRRELANGVRETVQYSPQGRVLLRLRADAQERRHDTFYSYSGEGDLLQVADSERGLTRYEYDAAHRLSRVHPPGGAAPEDYEYDAAGNLLHMPGLNYFGHEPDPDDTPMDPGVLRPSEHGVWLQSGNQLYRAHGEYFKYDARGRIVERNGPERIIRYRYDELDQLVSVEDSTGLRVAFRYDALGRRTQKDVNGELSVYYWNRDRLAAELLPDGKLRIYVYADIEHALVPFSFVDYASADADPATGAHYFISTNHLGVPETVIDSEGKIVWQATIEPYGRARISIGEGFHQPLRFPGHYCDVETDLHYNRYRCYLPDLGRYLQSDPIDIEGGHNLYAYAQDGNPLRDVDLLGLACEAAETLLKRAIDENIIDENGDPVKPFSRMSTEEKQVFCVARAVQLEKSLPEAQQRRTTISVSIVSRQVDGRTQRKVVVSASSDDGSVPEAVTNNLRPREEVRESNPKLKAKANGREHPNAEANRQQTATEANPNGNRDGAMMRTDPAGSKPRPYQKRNQRHPRGQSEHHAEQRTNSTLEPGEQVEAMGPNKKCCGGCQRALGQDGLDKVHPTMRDGK
jgi:RHS repeat-associated protein